MNSKELKKLRARIKPIQLEWLQTLLSEEESEKINLKNIEGLLPDQTHLFGGGQLHLSYMTDKWIMKHLKKHPYIKTFKELREIIEDG